MWRFYRSFYCHYSYLQSVVVKPWINFCLVMSAHHCTFTMPGVILCCWREMFAENSHRFNHSTQMVQSKPAFPPLAMSMTKQDVQWSYKQFPCPHFKRSINPLMSRPGFGKSCWPGSIFAVYICCPALCQAMRASFFCLHFAIIIWRESVE